VHKFSLYNQILLSLFDVSNAFHDCFLAHIEVKMCQTITQMISWNAFETLNKLNKNFGKND